MSDEAREVNDFISSLSSSSSDDDTTLETKVDILRKTILFLILEMQTMYTLVLRNSSLDHDGVLNKKMGEFFLISEQIMEGHYLDLLGLIEDNDDTE